MRGGRRLARLAALAVALTACKGRNEARPLRPHETASKVLLQPSAPPVVNVATIGAAPGPGPSRSGTLSVPRAARKLTPSGHFDIKFWGDAVNTHTLLDDAGKGAVPVSEARFLWGDGQLYVSFYAGDLDLQVHEKAHDGRVWKDDSVSLSFFRSDGKKWVIAASPTGVLADASCPPDARDLSDAGCDMHWESHARIGVDMDGTPNKLGDFDEEWNIQFAIPLRSLGAAPKSGTHFAFSLKRCEVAFDGQRACGAFGSNDQPAELVLE